MNSATIIKHLKRVAAGGRRESAVFDDFLDIAEASLRMLPVHAEAVATTGALAEDPDDIKELWERLRKDYTPAQFDHLRDAFGALLDAGEALLGVTEPPDIVGEVFEQWGHPSKSNAQFFTPPALSSVMAEMAMLDHDTEALVRRRIAEAIKKYSPGMIEMFGLDPMLPYTARHLAETCLPYAIEHYEPITVNDCAVGSGGMLLAAAKQVPSWMVRMGLIQFYGNDIDRTCVQMCKINVMLYQMNSWGLKYRIAGMSLAQAMPDAAITVGEPVEDLTKRYNLFGEVID